MNIDFSEINNALNSGWFWRLEGFMGKFVVYQCRVVRQDAGVITKYAAVNESPQLAISEAADFIKKHNENNS